MCNSLDSKIINVCRYEYNNFLNKANVIGVGYGYKYIKNIQTNEKVIQVFVEKKVPSSCLNEKNHVPSFYKNIKTDVIETGLCVSTELTDRIRPVTGGYCIGPAGLNVCGTYGGLVKDADGYYLLSNNHVIAGWNLLPLGNPILQTCTTFGGVSPRDVVGELSRFIPIKFKTATEEPVNYVDCAIAKVKDLSLVSPYIQYIGIPKGIDVAELMMDVKIIGAISEFIFGNVISINATMTINYTIGEKALFKELILVRPSCEKGDSGAFVLGLDDYVVGLNFASSNSFSIINPMVFVINALNVELVTNNDFKCTQL